MTSGDCGEGVITRTRDCTGPFHNGLDCVGYASQEQPCTISCDSKSYEMILFSSKNCCSHYKEKSEWVMHSPSVCAVVSIDVYASLPFHPAATNPT